MSRKCRLAHCSEKGLLAEHTHDGFGGLVLFELTACGLLVLVSITFPLLSCFCTVATAHLPKQSLFRDNLLTFLGGEVAFCQGERRCAKEIFILADVRQSGSDSDRLARRTAGDE